MSQQHLSFWPSWPLPFGLELERVPGGPCPYLPGRSMQVRGFLSHSLAGAAYQKLLDAGFRRSGEVLYQPACDGCRACVPIRVPVEAFRPDRSQRRCRARNADLEVTTGEPLSTDEKYELFVRYLHARHADGAMSDDRASFDDFLYASNTDSLEFCFREQGRLVAVGLCDVTPDALSAVYTYCDPDSQRGLGTFSCLSEIAFAAHRSLSYYYLGYWISECRKMAYKTRFRPCEALGTDGLWRSIDTRPQSPT